MAALPAYMRIRQYVVDLIMTHDQGNVRIMSERELCREFGVTRPTARRALKELVDDGYLETRPGLGMFVNPAKVANNTMVVRKSYKVLLVFSDGRFTDLDGFFMDILARLSDRMKSLPIRLRIANLNYGDKETAMNELEMYNADGLIWVRPNSFGQKLINAVKSKLLTVVTGMVAAGIKNHVTVDFRQSGRQAAAWFLDRGLENTVFVGNALEQMSVKEEVFKGWCDEYIARGLEFDVTAQADMNSSIREKLKQLMSERKVEGIFSFGSEYAVVDSVLEELNVSGKECPVVADENYYGFYRAKFQPAAKIIMSPPEESELAVDKLFQMMQKSETEFDEIILKSELIPQNNL